METARKQRIFSCVLIGLVVWPLIHYGLVQVYGINPWRFAGFAMYGAPTPQPRLGFEGRLADGSRLTTERAIAALGNDAPRVNRFLEERKLWGKLSSPEPIGRLLFEQIPELQELTIVINTVTLEPLADTMSHTSDYYACARPSSSQSRSCAPR